MAPEANDAKPVVVPAMAEDEARILMEDKAYGLLTSMSVVEHAQRDRLLGQLTGDTALTYFRALEESVFQNAPTHELRSARESLCAATDLTDTQILAYFEERMTPAIKRHQTATLAAAEAAKEEEGVEAPEADEGHAGDVGKKTRRASITNTIGVILLEHLPIHPKKPTPAGYFAPGDVQKFKKDPALRQWFDAIAVISSCESTDDPRYASAIERQQAAKVAVAQLLNVDVDSQVLARIQTSFAKAASERSEQQEL